MKKSHSLIVVIFASYIFAAPTEVHAGPFKGLRTAAGKLVASSIDDITTSFTTMGKKSDPPPLPPKDYLSNPPNMNVVSHPQFNKQKTVFNTPTSGDIKPNASYVDSSSLAKTENKGVSISKPSQGGLNEGVTYNIRVDQIKQILNNISDEIYETKLKLYTAKGNLKKEYEKKLKKLYEEHSRYENAYKNSKEPTYATLDFSETPSSSNIPRKTTSETIYAEINHAESSAPPPLPPKTRTHLLG